MIELPFIDLPLVWAILIAFSVLLYVVLDGFDLGLGILFPLVRDGKQRDTMINSVAPVWDGNETWLVLGGGGLFAAFPLAYAVLLPALYAPLIAMLLALIFRGVAFEFRHRGRRSQHLWDIGFVVGSVVATFAQGIVLGTVVQGIELAGRAYGGGWWDWLSPFSLLTGAALLVGYALLGAAWLILKTEGGLQRLMYRLAGPLCLALIVMIGAVSLFTPILRPEIFERWFNPQNLLFLWPVPLLVGATGLALLWAIREHRERLPFPFALALFVMSYIGLGISLYPNIVPPGLSFREAAAPDSSLAFLLVGAAPLLAIILAYTGYAYWVFRGKVGHEEGYH